MLDSANLQISGIHMYEALLNTIHSWIFSTVAPPPTMSNAQGGKEPSASKPDGEQGNSSAMNKDHSNVGDNGRDNTVLPAKDLSQVQKSEANSGIQDKSTMNLVQLQ